MTLADYKRAVQQTREACGCDCCVNFDGQEGPPVTCLAEVLLPIMLQSPPKPEPLTTKGSRE